MLSTSRPTSAGVRETAHPCRRHWRLHPGSVGVIAIWLAALVSVVAAQQLPTGEIIPSVTCTADPSQSYALYLPPNYSAARPWPIILGFDPGGRGRNPVERYRAAAERYGFIVAGSNNSRNGSDSWARGAMAMANDVTARFSVDGKRMYTAGMSGGARVALAVGIGSEGIAGVIASSAGYPDSIVRKSLPFPVFATAGTEDFNHLELRLLDRELTTPHHLAIFEGGHTWLSSDLAVEAVEWLEVQAIRSGIKPRDAREIDLLFAKRTAHLDLKASDTRTFLALQSLVADFDGLKDVSPYAARVAALAGEKSVKDGLRSGRDEDEREARTLNEIRAAEKELRDADVRGEVLIELRQTLRKLSDQARKPNDSADRRLARRLLATVGGGGGVSITTDPEFLTIINQYRLPRTR